MRSTPTPRSRTCSTRPTERRAMGRLDGKVAVITGSSGGIGGATAERFVAEGAIVVGVDVAGEADYNVDVTDEDAIRDLYASVRERYGRIDVLFNNAGISPDD